MTRVKAFKTYTEQVELLRSRGMRIDNVERAEEMLARLNYYRLSGYWYPMRLFSSETGQACDEFVGLRVKMCVWLGVSRGLDLAFLNAD